MTSFNPRAENLFARLFAYVPRPSPEAEGQQARRRNALEFCTEALAWCIRRSRSFRGEFFKLPAFVGCHLSADDLEVNTQLSFTGEGEEPDDTEKPSPGRFDLVLRSKGVLVVIESKVAPDTREHVNKQIGEYRKHISAGTLGRARARRIILLTPYSQKHDADAHLSWSEVRDALCDTVINPQTGPEDTVLEEFSDFLKIRNLTTMKLPPLNSLLPALKTTGPLLAGLEEIFASLRNDDVGRALFRKDAVVPKMDWNQKEDGLWYGI